MSRIKKADFYYGAILSHLVHDNVCPALLEAGNDRQVYEFTTNEGDFTLFSKYCSTPLTSNDEYASWQFVFTANDVEELRRYLASTKHLSVGLVCGETALSASRLAFLHREEIQALFDAGKTALTVSYTKGEHSYRIYMGGSRENCRRVKCTRRY